MACFYYFNFIFPRGNNLLRLEGGLIRDRELNISFTEVLNLIRKFRIDSGKMHNDQN